jgi:DNA-binding transcriptional LysR family regulator
MYIDDLRRLLVIADHDRMTDAAASLQLPQPTVSRLVARAEEELGTRLFERTPHGVVLNPYGELARTAAHDIVRCYDKLLADLAGLLDPESGQVRLAFLDSMATSLVPLMLHDFRIESPRMRILLSQENGQAILSDLADGSAELAITSPRPDDAHGWIPLQRQRIVAVVPPDHELAPRRRLRLEELAGQPFVTVPLGYGFRTLVEELFAEVDGHLQIAFESQDLTTIEGLVGAGLGVALLPEHLAGATKTRAIPIVGADAVRDVGLTWRADRELAAPAQRFLDFARTWKSPDEAA